jgi:hypothetical protein
MSNTQDYELIAEQEEVDVVVFGPHVEISIQAELPLLGDAVFPSFTISGNNILACEWEGDAMEPLDDREPAFMVGIKIRAPIVRGEAHIPETPNRIFLKMASSSPTLVNLRCSPGNQVNFLVTVFDDIDQA